MHQSCPAKTIGRSPSPSITPNTAKVILLSITLTILGHPIVLSVHLTFLNRINFTLDLIRALLPLYKTKP